MPDVDPIHFQEKDGTDIYLYPVSYFLHAIKRELQGYKKWEDSGIIPEEFVIRITVHKNKPPYRFYTDKTIRKFKKWFAAVGPKSRPTAARKRMFYKLFEAEYNRVKRAKLIGRVTHTDIKKKRTEEQEKRRAEYFAEHLEEGVDDMHLKDNWSTE